jgi:hypothetical protein
VSADPAAVIRGALGLLWKLPRRQEEALVALSAIEAELQELRGERANAEPPALERGVDFGGPCA